MRNICLGERDSSAPLGLGGGWVHHSPRSVALRNAPTGGAKFNRPVGAQELINLTDGPEVEPGNISTLRWLQLQQRFQWQLTGIDLTTPGGIQIQRQGKPPPLPPKQLE